MTYNNSYSPQFNVINIDLLALDSDELTDRDGITFAEKTGLTVQNNVILSHDSWNQNEGATPENPAYYRFTRVSITLTKDANGQPLETGPITRYFVYDNEYENLLIKISEERRTIKTYIRMPYKYKEGAYRYQSAPFAYNEEERLIPQNTDYPVGSVYFKPRGYGMDNLTDNFDEWHPWDLDPPAFENSLLRNNRDDYVYAANPDTSKYLTNYGLFWQETDDVTHFGHNTFPRIDNTVTLRRREIDTPSPYNFYKTTEPVYSIFS
jgi:hypothetical protein